VAAPHHSILAHGNNPPFPLGTFTFNASTAPSMNVAWPSGHQVDDIGLLLLANANAATITTPATWSGPLNVPSGQGPSNGANSIKLGIYWKRATSGAEAAASCTTASDMIGAMIAIRNADRGASPIEAIVDSNSASSASVVCPSTTILGAARYIIGVVAGGLGPGSDNNASVSWTTNSNLESFTELVDFGSGIGAILGAFGGALRSIGASGTTSGTLGTAGVQDTVTLAVKPM
jgi:hypothetical protein